MSRLMSVALTEQSVVERRKTVTRRLGWWENKNGKRLLLPGDRLTLCRKVMGRKAGEPVVRLADVEIIGVTREILNSIEDEDVEREGFALDDLADFDPGCFSPNYCTPGGCDCGRLGTAFLRFFAHHMKCQPDGLVTRIEWRYLDEVTDA